MHETLWCKCFTTSRGFNWLQKYSKFSCSISLFSASTTCFCCFLSNISVVFYIPVSSFFSPFFLKKCSSFQSPVTFLVYSNYFIVSTFSQFLLKCFLVSVFCLFSVSVLQSPFYDPMAFQICILVISTTMYNLSQNGCHCKHKLPQKILPSGLCILCNKNFSIYVYV